jgi:nitrite reductase/ring-hydroxylating ferredoxin subunit
MAYAGIFRRLKHLKGQGQAQALREDTMATEEKKPGGPDLSAGVAAAELTRGAVLTGHVGDDEVLLVRQGGKLFALSAYCTHYHGPLADGLLVGETIRCPWHHAHFNLQTGEAIAAPALAPVTCWAVEEKDGKIFVKNKKTQPAPDKTGAGERFIIIGGGAAGFAAAEMLRRRGFAGSISMLSNDEAAPVDRPNLSKD